MGHLIIDLISSSSIFLTKSFDGGGGIGMATLSVIWLGALAYLKRLIDDIIKYEYTSVDFYLHFVNGRFINDMKLTTNRGTE